MFRNITRWPALLCTTFLISVQISAGSTTEHKPLTANEIVARMGIGTNLGNTFETTAYKNPWDWDSTRDFVDAAIDAGFVHIRIPINWMRSGPKADADGNIDHSNDELQVAIKLIDYVIYEINPKRREAGLQEIILIVNTHHETWFGDDEDDVIGRPNFDSNMAILENIWRGICELFAHYPQETLIFELFNEPDGYLRTGPWAIATVIEMNKRLHRLIREFELSGERVHADRNLMFGGTNWNSPAFLRRTYERRVDLPGEGNDPYVMGTFHWYYNPDTGETGEEDVVSRVIPVLEEFTFKHNIPVVMGEFGYDHRGEVTDEVLTYYRELANGALEAGFAITVWDDNGWFQIYNRQTREFNPIKDVLIELRDNEYPRPIPEQHADTVLEINGIAQSLDIKPRLIDRQMMVPLQELFALLGANVKQDSGSAQAEINGNKLHLKAGEPSAHIGERRVHLGASPVFENEDLMVPLKLISEVFARPAEWYEVTNVIRIGESIDNSPPSIDLEKPQTVTAGDTIRFQALAKDTDEPDQPLTFRLINAPEGAKLKSTGHFSWSPPESAAGKKYTFEIEVSDGMQSAAESITVTVTPEA